LKKENIAKLLADQEKAKTIQPLPDSWTRTSSNLRL
jgi:hypothetical protein